MIRSLEFDYAAFAAQQTLESTERKTKFTTSQEIPYHVRHHAGPKLESQPEALRPPGAPAGPQPAARRHDHPRQRPAQQAGRRVPSRPRADPQASLGHPGSDRPSLLRRSRWLQRDALTSAPGTTPGTTTVTDGNRS